MSSNAQQYTIKHKRMVACTAALLFMLVVMWGVPSRMEHYTAQRQDRITEAETSWHTAGTGIIQPDTAQPSDYGRAWVDIKVEGQPLRRLVDADAIYGANKVTVWDCSSSRWQICDSEEATLIDARSDARPWTEAAAKASRPDVFNDLVNSISGAIVNLQALVLLVIIGIATWQYHKRRQTLAELWYAQNIGTEITQIR